MKKYEMISLEKLNGMTIKNIVTKYNDAVETIWYLEHELAKLHEENDQIWAAYEEVSNELYG